MSDKVKADYFNNYFIESVANLKGEVEIQHGHHFNMFRSLHTTSCRLELGTINEAVINEIISNIKINLYFP